MLKNVTDLKSQDFSEGLNTNTNIFRVTEKQSPDMTNILLPFDGSIEKRRGSNPQNSTILTEIGSAGFTVDVNQTLTDGLQAGWRLDATIRERVDSFGGHTLTDVNSSGFAAGILANAATFIASSNQGLLHVNTSTLDVGDEHFSMTSWFFLDSTGNFTIVGKRNPVVNEDVVLLLHMDGTEGSTDFTDNSITPHTVTASANAQITSAQSVFGDFAGTFNGTTDELLIPDSADWDLGTEDYTVDFRAFWNTDLSGQRSLFARTNGSGGTGWRIGTDGTNFFIVHNVNTNVATVTISATDLSADKWFHVAASRSGGFVRLFLDGSLVASGSGTQDLSFSTQLAIAARHFDASPTDSFFNGYIDEFRIIKGRAEYVDNFTPPTSAYINPSTAGEYQYVLGVRSDNQVLFTVSSSGTASDGTVIATSFGAVDTATWYFAAAWHDPAGNKIGVDVNANANTAAYTFGVRPGSAPFVLGALSNGNAENLDGRMDETYFWTRTLTTQERIFMYNSGNANQFVTGFGQETWGSFDFGATDKRWHLISAGSGVYASSNLGVTYTAVGTSQSPAYQHYERSGSVVFVTSDVHDPVLWWDGSGGTHFVGLDSSSTQSAPVSRFAINHQGFFILMNTKDKPRNFKYEDVSFQLTGSYTGDFDLPSSNDDEITGAIVLRKLLYVSLRQKIYRLSYVGGNPDWSFLEVKSWGFVPRTMKKIFLKDIGEVIIGMSWDKRIRLFDGADDKIISDNVEEDNFMAEFSLKNVSFAGSGLENCHAEVDDNQQQYKLNVVIGANSLQTTHILNFSGRTLAFYPYDNQPWSTMVMTESANQRYLLAGDRSGFVYLLNSGNLDKGVTAIDEHWDSPFLYEKSPSEVAKLHKHDLFFCPTSSGTIYYQDRIDFSNTYKTRKTFDLIESAGLLQIKQSIDIPSLQNAYQYRLTSSSNQANPWVLNRSDLFVAGKGIGHNP